MPKKVRIKAENGDEITVGEAFAESVGATPLSKPAVDRTGRPLPRKPALRLRRAEAETPEAGSTATPTLKARKASVSKENQ